MRPQILLIVFLNFVVPFFCYAQTVESPREKSTSDTTFRITINPDLNRQPFDVCETTNVYIYADKIVQEVAFLRKNFTDQFLEVCATGQLIPASRIYGFSLDKKFYRSAHTHDMCYVFAERIVKGKTSLFYCRNQRIENGVIDFISSDSKNPDYTNKMIIEEETPMRYKNDFAYFISPKSDTTKMVYVNNSNIGEIAKTYFSDCESAYSDAMRYKQKYKMIQRITLPVAFISMGFYWVGINDRSTRLKYFKNPLFTISAISLATYIYYKIKAHNRYLHPYDMIRIVTKYNNCK